MWAKVILPPANGVAQLCRHEVGQALPQSPPLLQVPYGAAGAGLTPVTLEREEAR